MSTLPHLAGIINLTAVLSVNVEFISAQTEYCFPPVAVILSGSKGPLLSRILVNVEKKPLPFL